MRLARAAATVGSLTLLSRFAGFARDMLLAAVIGAGPAADAVLVAVRLATLVRRLLADGALNVSFVPLYAEARAEGPAAARAFSGAVLGLALAFGLLAGLTAIAAMPALVALQAPGFLAAPGRFAAAIHLARLATLYLPLAGPVAVLGAMLQAEGRFGPAAVAAVSFNLVLIAALALARPLGFAPAPGFALATAVAGLAQLGLVAVPAVRAGFVPARPRLGSPLLRRLGRRVLPGAASVGIGQLNALVGIAIASLLPAGAISALYYAERLAGLPLGVVGAAMATALLPALAGHAAAGDHGAARSDLSAALTLGLGLALPAAFGLVAAAWPIVAVLFGRGAFAPDAVVLTARVLAAAAAALPAQALVRILTSVHYATGDTARPLRFAAWAALANAAIGLALARPFGPVGIALAASLASWLQAGLAARDLRRRGWAGYDPALAGRIVRLAAAALVMAAAVALVAHRLAPVVAAPGHGRWLALAAILATGLGVYGLAVLASGVLGSRPLRRVLTRFRDSAAS